MVACRDVLLGSRVGRYVMLYTGVDKDDGRML